MHMWQAIILAIVEGLTEYLPVSSTGHMIVTSSIMGISENPFVKDYTVIVQFGAILSVVVIYWRRFLVDWSLYKKLFIAFLPAAVIGLLIKKQVDIWLGDVQIVAYSFIVGGVLLLFVDKWFERTENNPTSVDDLSPKGALVIGFCQCIAMIPGVSRSAATIIGGLTQKLSRKTAAEFSFFLAVPTLTAATMLKVVKIYKDIQPSDISVLLVGNLIAFIVGILSIRAFIGYLTLRGFKIFGYYRIAMGILILILVAMGHHMSTDM
jgi:undecaprenyl-diphosphatase